MRVPWLSSALNIIQQIDEASWWPRGKIPLVPTSRASGGCILPPLWCLSRWIIMPWPVLFTSRGTFLWPALSVCTSSTHCYSEQITRDNIVFEDSQRSGFKSWFCLLPGKNYSTSLAPSLHSKVRNSHVCMENTLKEERLTTFLAQLCRRLCVDGHKAFLSCWGTINQNRSEILLLKDRQKSKLARKKSSQNQHGLLVGVKWVETLWKTGSFYWS